MIFPTLLTYCSLSPHLLSASFMSPQGVWRVFRGRYFYSHRMQYYICLGLCCLHLGEERCPCKHYSVHF